VQSAAELKGVHNVEEAVAAVKHALKSLGRQAEPAIWLKAKETADHLTRFATARLEQLAANLMKEIAETGADLKFTTPPYALLRLEDLPYAPNRADYEQGRGLHIDHGQPIGFAVIEVQAHGVGSKFRGLIAFVTGFLDESGRSAIASREGFLVNYAESYESAERRFRPWLEESLVNALTMWRKSL